MKKMSFIGVLLILTVFSCHAQSVFSKQNLKQASQEDLNRYLKEAKNQNTVGKILIIGGVVSIASSFVIVQSDLDTAATILGIGMGATIIGIPLMILGNSRVKKVNKALSEGVSLEIAPCSFHNYQAYSHQSGVTFRFKF